MLSNHRIVKSSTQERAELKQQVADLRQQIDKIKRETDAFEIRIRMAISNELIEEQELSVLYKQQKKAKKEQRLLQKQRGKNFKQPTGIVKLKQSVAGTSRTQVDEKELKRLYREAMLYVHPDKFSMAEDKLDLAHEATAQLISIYKTGDLSALTAFHAHILSGQAIAGIQTTDSTKLKAEINQHLKNELAALRSELESAKTKRTYQVWQTYENPDDFIDELRDYYQDRISKLRKRTRS